MTSANRDAAATIAHPTAPSILVLSLGNEMLKDRGIGVHVVRQLSEKYWPSTVTFLEGGTLGLVLRSILERFDGLIIIDAANLHASPGTIRTYEGTAMEHFVVSLCPGTASACQLKTVVMDASKHGYLPDKRALAVVQPEDEGWGQHLEDSVAAVLPELCKWVEGTIRRWQT